MKSRVSVLFLVVIFTFLGFNAGYLFGQSPIAPIQFFNLAGISDTGEATSPIMETWQLVHARYYEQPVDDDALVQGAIDGMLASLGDQHTRYLSPEAEEAARLSMQGEFQGIGAEVEAIDGNITVVSPIDGSPAEAAGLLPGDILRQADGVDLTGMDVSEAAGLVRGPAGTAVSLLIERDGETFTVEITRDTVELPSVRGEMLDDGIAYARLSQFGDRSPEELQALLEELLAQDPVGLILDLRRNPGGALTSAIDIADIFLPEGTILTERFGNGRSDSFKATDEGIAQDIPLVVLVDEGSASASEVLAGAIRDHERGILVGQTTFGKGTVQTWQELSNGGGVRITIARWLTPDETWVHETGLEPDYVVVQPELADGEEWVDVQLQTAVDYLLGRPITSAPTEQNDG
ncbi:MAG: S41 family peptidase [Anaerolineales bacterium]|nr:S41 family peptidase [Anaerolineales bacterium]MCB8991589.1 S41 family peptidase [Ardenticatenaceae bacterium]MCB9004218.1 S41 family peptidase [Ardenticatenaceae bacterium]